MQKAGSTKARLSIHYQKHNQRVHDGIWSIIMQCSNGI